MAVTATGKDKVMARPKKITELKRSHNIMLRLNDTEYAIVTENAKNAHLPIAEYVRKSLMNKKASVKYEIVADIPELKKLIAEFGRIGNNLNQIARHFNTGGIHSQDIRKEISQCIVELYEMKYSVIKMGGDFLTTTKYHKDISGGCLYGSTETHSE